jgi:hypothetical protein
MTWDEWRTALVEFAIPVASILIPTGIAVWLARQERSAATKQRAADLERLQEEQKVIEARLAAEARRRAVEAALASMSDLVRAAFVTDPHQEAAIRIEGAHRLSAIRIDLTDEQDPVFRWIVRELGVVSAALNDRESPPEPWLPRAGDKIAYRAGAFAGVLTEWVTGQIDSEWFASAPDVPIEQTAKPGE